MATSVHQQGEAAVELPEGGIKKEARSEILASSFCCRVDYPTLKFNFGVVQTVIAREYLDVAHSEHTGTFRVKDDAGNSYLIHIISEVHDAATFGDLSATTQGPRSLITSDGQPVNRLGPKRYKLVLSGIILTSDDPRAP